MDISTNIGNYIFNFRVCALIVHDSKLLCHKADADVYYATPGGRVMTGESTKDAIVREIKEELGKDIEVQRLMAVVENFFEHSGKQYHELLFTYKCEFTSEQDKDLTNKLTCIEAGKKVNYEWIDIQDLQNADFRPAALKDIILKDDLFSHIVNHG